MPLILTSLAKALKSLEEVLQLPENSVHRDSAIQRFEYSYELSCKMLLRYLEATATNPTSIDQMSFKDTIRLAAEKGLIAKPEAWFRYREARNETSHAYDEKKAQAVYALLPTFLKDAQVLFTQLEKRAATL